MTLDPHRPPHPAQRKGYSVSQLASGLKRIGIRPGDVLVVHSSLKSLGYVQGGPETLIAALQRAVGPRGTIIMPAFSFTFDRVYWPVEPFDPHATPSQVGLVSEAFRRQPGVLRSASPTHSIAAWGRLAGELTAAPTSPEQAAIMGPWRRAAQLGAKVLMIGCSFNSLSLLHAAEELAPSPYLPIFNWSHLGWRSLAVTRDGRGNPLRVALHNVPGCSRNFTAAEALAHDRGLLREDRLGDARVLLFEAQAVLQLVVDELIRQPDFLLCPGGTCRACDDRRVIFEPTLPGAAEMLRLMIELLDQCGCRIAGSENEHRAAALIAGQMADCGLAEVTTHRFPIRAWEPGLSRLEVLFHDRWEAVATAPVAHSPATGARTVEGPVVHLESRADLEKLPRRRGAVAVLWNGYGESLDEFRRLMAAGFAAMILVDLRSPGEEVVADGVPAGWVPHFTTPLVSLPHGQAMRLFGHGAGRCRLKVGGRIAPGTSTVVTGEIPGRGPGVILLAGHHDSTFNSAAPDDNLCGVATVLQVAANLLRRRLRPQCTLRFCSFGAEEQLSEGARWYAFDSGQAGDVRFMLNVDSGGARCGSTVVHATGDDRLLRWFRRASRRSPLQFKLLPQVSPFSDQFPFNCLGVPSLWISRQTTTAGRHYHHTVRDTLAEISPDHLARLAEFLAGLVGPLARRAAFPFSTRLPEKMRAEIAARRRDWLGG